jgi:predicted alpha/beta-hydrolase family hydrolase
MASIVPPIEAFTDEAAGGPPVQGVLHRPAVSPRGSLVLAHGAGSNRDAPLLIGLAQAFAADGFLVLRCDLPFRQARPTGPPFPATAARDREGLRCAALAVRRLAPSRLVLGGHSYGGRQASLLAAQDPTVADGLLLLSYPLRPPRRPSEPRTAHLPALRVPTVFIHGTRDPFGTIEELESARAMIPAQTSLVAIEGASHDLAPRRRAGAPGADVTSRIVTALEALLEP